MGTYDTIGGTPRHDPMADFDPQCNICGLEAGSCVCPECAVCMEAGNPNCYQNHGLELSTMQEIARAAIAKATGGTDERHE